MRRWHASRASGEVNHRRVAVVTKFEPVVYMATLSAVKHNPVIKRFHLTCPRWRYRLEVRKVQVARLNDCQFSAVA